jgi:triacylglycerol lipase
MNTRHLVDPELLDLLDAFPPLELSLETLPSVREAEVDLPLGEPPGPEVVRAVDLQRRRIPGPKQAPDLEIALYSPRRSGGRRPCIFHIHGGGFVSGRSALMEPLHRPLAMELDCVLTSVDYRLAPETRFPGAIEDCYAALGWVVPRSAGSSNTPGSSVSIRAVLASWARARAAGWPRHWRCWRATVANTSWHFST